MRSPERCMCGDPECISCGTAQGTYTGNMSDLRDEAMMREAEASAELAMGGERDVEGRTWIVSLDDENVEAVGPLVNALNADVDAGGPGRVAILPLDALRTLQAERDEAEATLELQRQASIRATERWRKANPERGDIWPDLADLLLWLITTLDDADAERDRLEAEARDAKKRMWETGHENERLEAENERLRGKVEWIDGWCESYFAEPRSSLAWAQEVIRRLGGVARRTLQGVEAENERLRKAFLRHGRHMDDCALGIDVDCDCGYIANRRALEPETEG